MTSKSTGSGGSEDIKADLYGAFGEYRRAYQEKKFLIAQEEDIIQSLKEELENLKVSNGKSEKKVENQELECKVEEGKLQAAEVKNKMMEENFREHQNALKKVELSIKRRTQMDEVVKSAERKLVGGVEAVEKQHYEQCKNIWPFSKYISLIEEAAAIEEKVTSKDCLLEEKKKDLKQRIQDYNQLWEKFVKKCVEIAEAYKSAHAQEEFPILTELTGTSFNVVSELLPLLSSKTPEIPGFSMKRRSALARLYSKPYKTKEMSASISRGYFKRQPLRDQTFNVSSDPIKVTTNSSDSLKGMLEPSTKTISKPVSPAKEIEMPSLTKPAESNPATIQASNEENELPLETETHEVETESATMEQQPGVNNSTDLKNKESSLAEKEKEQNTENPMNTETLQPNDMELENIDSPPTETPTSGRDSSPANTETSLETTGNSGFLNLPPASMVSPGTSGVNSPATQNPFDFFKFGNCDVNSPAASSNDCLGLLFDPNSPPPTGNNGFFSLFGSFLPGGPQCD